MSNEDAGLERPTEHPLVEGCSSGEHNVLMLHDPVDGAPCPIEGCNGRLEVS